MTHVTILAAGTRGDVQPYIALAHGLLEAGHEVTLGANSEFRTLVASHGVPFHPLSVDYMALADSPEGRKALGGNPLTATRRMRSTAATMVRRLLDDAWTAAQDTDAVVYHPKTLAGPHLAERLGVPAFVAAAVPMLSPGRHAQQGELPAVGGRRGDVSQDGRRVARRGARSAARPARRPRRRARRLVAAAPVRV
jgi:sterol 3beta-glucosyltransferase